MKQKYQIALVLSRDKYIDLSLASNLFESKRSFLLFRWDRVKYFWEKDYKYGWAPWLQYGGGKWRRINKSLKQWKHHRSTSQTMMKAHMFFVDVNEFKNYIGDAQYRKMVVDLL